MSDRVGYENGVVGIWLGCECTSASWDRVVGGDGVSSSMWLGVHVTNQAAVA